MKKKDFDELKEVVVSPEKKIWEYDEVKITKNTIYPFLEKNVRTSICIAFENDNVRDFFYTFEEIKQLSRKEFIILIGECAKKYYNSRAKEKINDITSGHFLYSSKIDNIDEKK